MKTKFYVFTTLFLLAGCTASAQNRLMGAHMNCGGVSHYYIQHAPNEVVEIARLNWTPTGGYISNFAGDHTWIEVTWTAPTGSITVSGNDYKINNQPAPTETITVSGCGTSPSGTHTYAYDYITSQEGYAMPANLKIRTRLYVDSGGVYSNKNIYMEPNTTIVIGGNDNKYAKFDNCNFYMGSGSRILFEENTNTEFYKCNFEAFNNHTWKGILLDRQYFNIYLNGSRIADADTAILFTGRHINGSGINFFGNLFEKNGFSIYIDNHFSGRNASSTEGLSGNEPASGDPIMPPTYLENQGNTFIRNYMKPGFVQNHTASHIFVVQSERPLLEIKKNIFNDLVLRSGGSSLLSRISIFLGSEATDINVSENLFINDQYAAIYANPIYSIPKLTISRNTFRNSEGIISWKHCVDINNNYFIDEQDFPFRTGRKIFLYIENAPNKIYNNTFDVDIGSACITAGKLGGFGSSRLEIYDNSFFLKNIIPVDPTVIKGERIHNYTAPDAIGLHIKNNTIHFLDSYKKCGIDLFVCGTGTVVKQNTIISENALSNQTGIKVSSTGYAKIENNVFERIGCGIRISSSCAATKFKNNIFNNVSNTMFYNSIANGYYFEPASVISDQGLTRIDNETGNLWIGNYGRVNKQRITGTYGGLNIVQWFWGTNNGVFPVANCDPSISSTHPLYGKIVTNRLSKAKREPDQAYENLCTETYREQDLFHNAWNDYTYSLSGESEFKIENPDETILTLMAIGEAMEKQNWTEAERLNNELPENPEIVWYYKTVNEIYLNSFAKGRYELDDQEKETLLQIADLCLSEGYHAVAMARSILRYYPIKECEYTEIKEEDDENPKSSLSANEQEISVYPNPANEKVYIKNNPQESLFIEIHDIAGKRVLSDNIENTTGFSVQQLQPGIYVCKIFNNEGELLKTEKLAISR